MAVAFVTPTVQRERAPTFDKQGADQHHEDTREEMKRGIVHDQNADSRRARRGGAHPLAVAGLDQPTPEAAAQGESLRGEGMGCEDGFSTRAKRGKRFAVSDGTV